MYMHAFRGYLCTVYIRFPRHEGFFFSQGCESMSMSKEVSFISPVEDKKCKLRWGSNKKDKIHPTSLIHTRVAKTFELQSHL